jgi:hypothetical protein
MPRAPMKNQRPIVHKHHEGNYFKFDCGAREFASGLIEATVTVTFFAPTGKIIKLTVGEFIKPDGFDPKDWPSARFDLYWKLCGLAWRKHMVRIFGEWP